MEKLRVVVLVSSDLSDLYFANFLCRELNVVGVVVEKQHEKNSLRVKLKKNIKYVFHPAELYKKIIYNKNIQKNKNKAYQVALTYFGRDALKLSPPGDCSIIYTSGQNSINNVEYVEQIKLLSPDVIAVCGCSILKCDILNIPKVAALNLHGGLSQQYRGIWTTLWACYNNEPEYVGATVHHVSPRIDDGDIVYQGRPEITSEENPETLYAKVVRLGVRMMTRAINDLENGCASRYPLERKGRLYLGKMVTPEIIQQAWQNTFAAIENYLGNKSARDEPVLSIMRGNFPDKDSG